jgi:uncharacterized protein YjbJ (UPF0337 family)
MDGLELPLVLPVHDTLPYLKTGIHYTSADSLLGGLRVGQRNPGARSRHRAPTSTLSLPYGSGHKGELVAGKIKEKWGDLTDDDLDKIAGRRDKLEGLIQQRYGLTKDQARAQIEKRFNE